MTKTVKLKKEDKYQKNQLNTIYNRHNIKHTDPDKSL